MVGNHVYGFYLYQGFESLTLRCLAFGCSYIRSLKTLLIRCFEAFLNIK